MYPSLPVEPASEELEAADARAAWLDSLFRLSPELLCTTGPAGVLQRVNASWEALLGLVERDLLNKPLADLIHSGDRAAMESAAARLVLGEPVVAVESRVRHADGSHRWIAWSAGLVPGSPGSTFYRGVDVTDRRRAEELNVAFHLLGEQLNEATSPEEAARVVLGVADGLFGWDACWLELFNPDGQTSRLVVLMDILEGERQDVPAFSEEQPISRSARRALKEGPRLVLRDQSHRMSRDSRAFGDTSRASLSIMIVPIRSAETAVGALSIQSYTPHAYRGEDLTTLHVLADYCAGALKRTQAEESRRLLEGRLRQSQKLEAIGQLAGGVAHDFNNMLAVILGYTDLLLLDTAPWEPAFTPLQQIKQAGDRSAALTRQLLAYSRRQVLLPQVLDLNALIGELCPLIQRLVGESTVLELQLAPRVGRVKADPGQIQQALMSLAANARDAMPVSGRLTIRTADVTLDASVTRRHPEAQPGDYVLVELADTGTGMSPDVLAHMFEPFFTTKPQDKGIGLGLASVYGIIKQSGGHVEVESEPDRGTTFRLYVPCCPISTPGSAS